MAQLDLSSLLNHDLLHLDMGHFDVILLSRQGKDTCRAIMYSGNWICGFLLNLEKETCLI